MPITIPLTTRDLMIGSLSQMALVLQHWPSFKMLSVEETVDILAKGFGYRGAHSVVPTEIDKDTATSLPESKNELIYVVAWQLYQAANIPISEAYMAIYACLERIKLGVDEQYHWMGFRKDRCNQGPALPRLDANDLKQAVFKDLPRYRKAIDHSGRVFWRFLAEEAIGIANCYWSEDSGISKERLVKEICSSSWIALEDALTLYGRDLTPIGLDCVTVYDIMGAKIGYGVTCPEIAGTLKYIYPPDGVLFKEALTALWRRQPVPRSIMQHLPDVVFLDDYDPPFLPPLLVKETPVEVLVETRDVEEHGRSAMTIKDGVIAAGVEVTIEGSPFVRPAYETDETRIEGLLGFKLTNASSVGDDQHEWLIQKAPIAIEHAACHLLFRVNYSLAQLAAMEQQWIANPANWGKVSAAAELTAQFAKPIQSSDSDVVLSGRIGGVEAQDLPRAGRRIVERCPSLRALDPKVLGEYALNYLGYRRFGSSDPDAECCSEFLAFATLRNLGCDPFSRLGRSPENWMGIYRLVRIALSKRRRTGEIAGLIAKVSEEARQLEIRCGKLLEIYERLDTFGQKRIFGRLVDVDFLDCTRDL